MDLEKYAIYIWFAGIAIVLLGALWLWINAFRTRIWWGLGFLLTLPIPVFIVMHFRRAWAPLLTCLVGVGMVFGAIQMQRVAVALDLEGIVTTTDKGEKAVILTGWKYKAEHYRMLLDHPDAVVVKMANSDVTDDKLHYLKDMKGLKKLDLNDAQVTDAGLAQLKDLPALEALDLRNTKITNQGFREHLMGMDSLRFLTLTGTAVAPETVQEWRKAKSGRKAMGP